MDEVLSTCKHVLLFEKYCVVPQTLCCPVTHVLWLTLVRSLRINLWHYHTRKRYKVNDTFTCVLSPSTIVSKSLDYVQMVSEVCDPFLVACWVKQGHKKPTDYETPTSIFTTHDM